MFKSILTMPVHGTSSEHGIPSGNIRSGHLVEDTPGILYAPKLEYISMRLVHFCVWMHLSSSCAHRLAQAVITETKVNLWGIIPSCCIWYKKLHCLLTFPSLNMPSKPGIPQKAVQLYSPWCHCSQLCIDLCRLKFTIQLECLLHVLLFEILIFGI